MPIPEIDVTYVYVNSVLTSLSNSMHMTTWESLADENSAVYMITPDSQHVLWLADNGILQYNSVDVFPTDTIVENGEYTTRVGGGDNMTTADIIQSMQGHLQDAYTSVQGKNGTIPTQKNLANLAGAIDSISTGTDTSSATAVAADILKDKTAYVATGKVTGTIETWAGEFEEISGGAELITFMIVNTTYQAEQGMTWEQWFVSKYNINDFNTSDTILNIKDNSVANKGDLIIANGIYAFPHSGGNEQ